MSQALCQLWWYWLWFWWWIRTSRWV
jgi:hypothetical protein